MGLTVGGDIERLPIEQAVSGLKLDMVSVVGFHLDRAQAQQRSKTPVPHSDTDSVSPSRNRDR